jgi:homoaconitase/3-isopropylmalate dehydratase large subunit
VPHTFAEKILAKNIGAKAVTPGQIVDASPDVALSHDNSSAISKIFYSLGLERVKYPERMAITLDHAAPPPTTKHAQNHAEVRQFVVGAPQPAVSAPIRHHTPSRSIRRAIRRLVDRHGPMRALILPPAHSHLHTPS